MSIDAPTTHGGDTPIERITASTDLVHDDWASLGLVGFNSRDRRSRPFNLLRSQILKQMEANGWRTLGITSPTPRVGKSFIAGNLAASLSRIPSMHTYLLDLDLRRGSIAELFGIADGQGLDGYLADETEQLDGIRRDVPGTNLSIYPAFTTHLHSAELLAGARMDRLLDAVQSMPGKWLCICDLPPAFANDDASIITRRLDAYLMVVEQGVTTAKQVRDAIDILSPAPCIGTVLNRYRGGLGGDDYGFGYGRQKGYDAYYG